MSKYMSIFSIVSLINGSYIYLFSEFHTCDIIDVQSIDDVSLPKIVRRLIKCITGSMEKPLESAFSYEYGSIG